MKEKSYILLTGATSSIGESIASHLSNKYNLILNGRNADKIAKTIALCSKENNHLAWKFDFNDIENLEGNLNDFLTSNNAKVSGFVHSAGFLKILPFRRITLELLQISLNIGFISSSLVIKVLLNKKINETYLRNIIFISSMASIRGAKAFNIYSATKGAVDALMRSLSVELAPNIRVNSILPGAIRTKATENIFQNENLVEQMSKDYPLGFGQPRDISNMVGFLLSDASRWITGQQLVIDGGRSINITS